MDISEWDRKGLNGKTARECTRDEIKVEVWEQLKRSLNYGDVVVLEDDQVHSWSLDPDISFGDDGTTANEEPLLVNLVDTWKLRPEAVTQIPNLFLASDYVRTFTDLATMEAANEAARRAVNGILEAAGSSAGRCQVWQLHEPEIFAPWRELDLIRYMQGLRWDDTLVQFGMSFVALANSTVSALESGSEEHDLYRSRVGGVSSPYHALLASVDREGPASALPDLRRDATALVERIVRVLALRLVEAQTTGRAPTTSDYARSGRVRIVPK